MTNNLKTLNINSSSPTQQLNANRNYGIDFLRVLSMFYVLILHTLGQGGVLSAAEEETPQYMFSWFLEMWAYCAVDIFALISGYVSYTEQEKKVNYSNYIVLWLQVVAYGVIVTLLFKLIHPELVTKHDLFQMFFPITNGLYWYFSAYTGLVIVMPLLNAGLRKCSKQSIKKMFVTIIVVFSVFDTVIGRFQLSKGYSFIWLVILYILGASIKKCDIGRRVKVWQALLIIVLCSILGWGWKIYGLEFEVYNISVDKSLLVSYTAPTVLIASIFYIIGFSKLNFSPRLKKLISFSAAGAFAVYILNCQRFIWKYGMKKRFVYLCNEKIAVIFLHTIAFSFVFLVGSIVIDHIRIWFFKVFRIRKLADRLVAFADKKLSGVK